MSQPLRVLTALPKNPNSFPDTHIVWLKTSCNQWPSSSFSPLRVLPHMKHTSTHTYAQRS